MNDILTIRRTIREELLECRIRNSGLITAVFKGSEGNYYTHIDVFRRVVHCDCKGFVFRGKCKHIKALMYLFMEYFIRNKPLGTFRTLGLEIRGIYKGDEKTIIFARRRYI